MRKAWEAYGYRLLFEWDQPELGKEVEAIILPDWESVEPSQPDSVVTLSTLGDDEVSVQLNEEVPKKSSLDQLQHQLKRVAHIDLATYAPGLVFVHSGVVKTPNGLLVIPARSYSGKSTLVKSLIERGARFFSDEYAVIDSEGYVRPFPRALCERKKGGVQEYTQASELGWSPDMKPEKIRALLVTRFVKDEEWAPVQLTQGEAVLKMLENTVSAQTNPSQAISFLAKSVKECESIQTPRDDAEKVADTILDWMKSL